MNRGSGKRSKHRKHGWSRQQRLKFKLTMARRKANKLIVEGNKLQRAGKLASSLSHTPTRLIPRFKSQVPDVDAIYHRFTQNLGPNARRFILAELMRFEATQQGASELQ